MLACVLSFGYGASTSYCSLYVAVLCIGPSWARGHSLILTECDLRCTHYLHGQRFEAEKQRKRAVIEESKARSFREKEKVCSPIVFYRIAWDGVASCASAACATIAVFLPSFVLGLLCIVHPQRMRELGQASRATSYVEEEKRIGRQHGMYSGFD